MAGEMFVGIAVFSMILIVLVFGWLSSEYAKGSQKLYESPLAERVPVVSTDKENVLHETMEAPEMRRVDGGREPLRNRVQPIKQKATSTTGRTDTAYGHPVVDTFDYSESSRSSSYSSSCSGSSSSSSSDSGSSSSSCD